ncbi:hypothetical protein [Aliiroseovarius sp. 2305UL8-7]|uniref:hypothetical protein n=1 Tax=Aliiroseovarius conchicola TaxID=3121637 RepID=UPI00352902EA
MGDTGQKSIGSLEPVNAQSYAASQIQWGATWEEIENARSLSYGFRIADDFWEFPASENANVRLSFRSIDFGKLTKWPAVSLDFEGFKRRVKRMVWTYVHQDPTKSQRTIVNNSKTFVSMMNALSSDTRFAPNVDDVCPDFFPFFSGISPSQFDLLVPAERYLRNGVYLIRAIGEITQDRFSFHPESYQEVRGRKRKLRNRDTYKAMNSNSLEALSDKALSKLLYVCQVFAGYVDIVEQAWCWHAHRGAVFGATEVSNGAYCAKDHEGGGYLDIEPENIESVNHAFENDVIQSNLERWVRGGIVEPSGKLCVPIFNATDTPYTHLSELQNVRVLQTTLTQIRTACLFYFTFLTMMRAQEVYNLKDDLYVPTDAEFDLIVGKVFKEQDGIYGQTRDWPYPRIAAPIVRSAQRAKTLAETINPKKSQLFLFRAEEPGRLRLRRLLSEVFGVSEDMNNLPQRMRPSAIAMVGRASRDLEAARITAGHDLIEQTSAYLKSNLNLRDPKEAEIIAEEAGNEHLKMDRRFGSRMLKSLPELSPDSDKNKILMRSTSMFIRQMGSISNENLELRERLQKSIDEADSDNFLTVLNALGEDFDTVAEFIGEGVRRNGPGRYCMAKRGGANFKGACSESEGEVNDTGCVPWCQYNFEEVFGLEQRAVDAERLIRFFYDHLDGQVAFFAQKAVGTLNEILKATWSFDGPLNLFKTDLRIRTIIQQIQNVEPDFAEVLDPYARRTMKEYLDAQSVERV